MSIGAHPDGWRPRAATAFDELVGPFYFPPGTFLECGFIADQRHANRNGVVHGGMIGTAFDVALGIGARTGLDSMRHVTVQIGVHYVGAMTLGEFATIRSEQVRVTRTLVFMRGVMTVGDRTVATADGIWKILSPQRAAEPTQLDQEKSP